MTLIKYIKQTYNREKEASSAFYNAEGLNTKRELWYTSPALSYQPYFEEQNKVYTKKICLKHPWIICQIKCYSCAWMKQCNLQNRYIMTVECAPEDNQGGRLKLDIRFC